MGLIDRKPDRIAGCRTVLIDMGKVKERRSENDCVKDFEGLDTCTSQYRGHYITHKDM